MDRPTSGIMLAVWPFRVIGPQPQLCGFFTAVGLAFTYGEVRAHPGQVIRPALRRTIPLRTKVYG